MTRLSIKQWAVLPALLLIFSALLPAQDHAYNLNFKFSEAGSNPCKPFIGVGTSKTTGGLNVDYTVDGTPATTYGVQKGDVILALDGVPVLSQSELLRERDKHQQGEAFTLTILRGGVEQKIQARFKACNADEMKEAMEQTETRISKEIYSMVEMEALMQDKMKGLERIERPILGVYENTDVNAEGIVIGTVIPGKGAEAAGLLAGDVVVNVDGQAVTGTGSLRNALNNHKPGDEVLVVFKRDGKTMRTKTTLSADRAYFTQNIERDPCKVFIGVYTSAHALNGRGTRVDGVIDGTPAKISGLQPGDIIMAFNDVPVSTYEELTRERDKNKPGDAFRLSIVRNGAEMEVDARFKSCDTPTPSVETVEVLEETPLVEQREQPKNVDNSLAIEVLEAYPNPTYGLLNVRFEAEALPTTVRILDIAGKTVYNKNLPRFDGNFNEQVNLSNSQAGNYTLSIEQGGKVRSKQIVLLPRA